VIGWKKNIKFLGLFPLISACVAFLLFYFILPIQNVPKEFYLIIFSLFYLGMLLSWAYIYYALYETKIIGYVLGIFGMVIWVLWGTNIFYRSFSSIYESFIASLLTLIVWLIVSLMFYACYIVGKRRLKIEKEVDDYFENKKFEDK